MSKKTKAIILSIGSELTNGSIRDLHGMYIADILNKTGISVIKIIQVPDDYAVENEIRNNVQIADILIVTGGLGPTSDDITKEIISKAAGISLTFNEDIWQGIINRYSTKISDTNRKQAYVPDGFSVIRNSCGTAPGLKGYIKKTLVYILPGPPSELKAMFQSSILPELREREGLSYPEELTGTAFLVSESTLEDVLQKNNINGLNWSTRVDYSRIIFSLKGGTHSERETLFTCLENTFNKIRIRHGEIEENILLFSTLMRAGKNIVFAESCTGGLCGKLLSDLPGSSKVFWGSIVVYANSAKEKLLGVDPAIFEKYGAVSSECVSKMANGALTGSSADISIAVSGIAGPDGDDSGKPVGTVWIAIKDRIGTEYSSKFLFSGDRSRIRKKSSTTVLLLAEKYIADREGLDTIENWQYI